MAITAEECAGLLRDALGNKPADTFSEEGLNWFADVAAAVSAYDAPKAFRLSALLPRISDINFGTGLMYDLNLSSRLNACSQFMTEARAIYTQLRLQTNTFVTAQVELGQVHTYFEEIRGLIASAANEVLFIDPYIDSEFVTRYLPLVPPGARVRLLTSSGQAVALNESVALYVRQHGGNVEIRAHPNGTMHDRHLIVDNRDVYQSGASFKDGAKNAPTTINQIVDVAADLIRAHEGHWAGARVVR